MKSFARPWVKSGLAFVVLVGFLAVSTMMTGCSDPSSTVVKDPSTTPNKRTARIEKGKGLNPEAIKKPAQ